MSAEPNWVARMGDSVRRRSRASWKVLLPTAAALGAGAALAVGAIPGSGGTITACYNTVQSGDGSDFPYGALRIIDPSDTTATDPNVYSCSTTEATMTWNQQGPRGPAGPTGNQGTSGAQGDAGATGQQGPTGPQGTTGPQGVPGQNGANGSSGSLIGATTFSIDATKQARLFMKLGNVIGPISGEAVGTKPTSNYVALASFAAGTEKAVTVGSGSNGAGAGKAELQEFQLTKAPDTDRAQLFKLLAGGKLVPTMQVVVASVSTGKTVVVATYTLKDVKITAIHDTAGPAKSAEIVVGQFAAMSATYGSGKNTVPAGWNQVKNAPSGFNLTTPTAAARDTSHARR